MAFMRSPVRSRSGPPSLISFGLADTDRAQPRGSRSRARQRGRSQCHISISFGLADSDRAQPRGSRSRARQRGRSRDSNLTSFDFDVTGGSTSRPAFIRAGQVDPKQNLTSFDLTSRGPQSHGSPSSREQGRSRGKSHFIHLRSVPARSRGLLFRAGQRERIARHAHPILAPSTRRQ
jgi:hypothetical protein